MENTNTINYENLIQKALKNVVKDALEMFEKDGAIGEHHFFITFKTNAYGVKLPAFLLNQYPDEMTIILQHQFENLEVNNDNFSVDLSFSGNPQKLVIDFDAITSFADPYAKFGLSFEKQEDLESKEEKPTAEVVSIDAFRKAKK